MEEPGFIDAGYLLHCGVYMLLRRREVVYVGQSKSLHRRLGEHINRRGKKPARTSYYGTSEYAGMMFDDILVRPCMLGDLTEIEIAMIRKYQPKYNVKGKKLKPDISIEELIQLMPMPAIAEALQPKPVPVYRRF